MSEITCGDIDHLMRALYRCDSDGVGIWPHVRRDGQLTILFNANDLFYWGTSDGEHYEEGDEDLLDECVSDLKAADPITGTCFLLELFCCRKRKMRPQYPCFRKYDRKRAGYFEDSLTPEVRALFDALGPEGSDRERG